MIENSRVRNARRIGSLLLLGVLWSFARPAQAELRTLGKGKRLALDPKQFTAEQRPRYEIFKAKCTKCHPMARPIAALQTGITPVSGGPFDDKGIKKYVVKMMRKPNSGLGKGEAREVILFLRYATLLARPPEPAP